MDKDRFLAKVQKSGDCWLWTAAASPHGLIERAYGKFWYEGKVQMAHRVSYKMFVGPIPDGLTIDHVKSRGCTSTLCVNPDHLEPVTNRENINRGKLGRHNATKTHCPRGHPYAGGNLATGHHGERYCLACRAAKNNRREACPDCGVEMYRQNISRHRRTHTP